MARRCRWKAAGGDEIRFKPVSLDRLVDAPVSAGQYYRVIDLTPPGEPIHHEIDLAADSEDALKMSPGAEARIDEPGGGNGKAFWRAALPGLPFLLTLSDHVAHFGLEHNESDDSRLGERALISPGGANSVAGLLAHEFVHSWNGNSGGRRICTRPITKRRWRRTCFGCTKD